MLSVEPCWGSFHNNAHSTLSLTHTTVHLTLEATDRFVSATHALFCHVSPSALAWIQSWPPEQKHQHPDRICQSSCQVQW